MTGSFYESFGEYRNTVSGQGQYAAVESNLPRILTGTAAWSALCLKEPRKLICFLFSSFHRS